MLASQDAAESVLNLIDGLRHFEVAQALRVPGHAAIQRFGQLLPVLGFLEQGLFPGITQETDLG
jgi:hypothetical protein